MRRTPRLRHSTDRGRRQDLPVARTPVDVAQLAAVDQTLEVLAYDHGVAAHEAAQNSTGRPVVIT